MNLLIIFFTGLTTGGLSCLAVQGGLLSSIIANQKEAELASKKTQKIKFTQFDKLDYLPVLSFLFAKLISHILLGFMLGLLGSFISLNLATRLLFQSFTALFMLATAMNLLDVHPIFRHLSFQPPKFLQKRIRASKKNQALFAPFILGLLTIFIPCGVTQAMEVLAISTANPIMSAAIMGTFVLGTSPLFATLGVATAKLSESWHKTFSKVAAVILIAMTIYTLNGVLIVLNSPLTLNKIFKPRQQTEINAVNNNGLQKITIDINSNGYSPRYLKIKQNIPTQLTLKSEGVYSCALSFVLNEYGIKANLASTDTKVFNFTPQNKGKFTYSCSMGMYTGTLEVY